MSDRGEMHRYEVTWHSGHVETISAHQVMWPSGFRMFGDASPVDDRVMFHAEIDGDWRAILIASTRDIRTVRDVTVTEREAM